jgi:hypothetical protein
VGLEKGLRPCKPVKEKRTCLKEGTKGNPSTPTTSYIDAEKTGCGQPKTNPIYKFSKKKKKKKKNNQPVGFPFCFLPDLGGYLSGLVEPVKILPRQ